jgi:ATP-dependent Clp protease ATP-binding subunit ClpA
MVSTPLFDRGTETYRRAVFFANHEAASRREPRITPEHLALGMLYEPSQELARAWPPGTATVEAAQAALRRAAARQSEPIDQDPRPLSAESMIVVRFANRCSTEAGDAYVGLEHLLQSLVTCPGTLLQWLGLRWSVRRSFRRLGLTEPVVETHLRTLRNPGMAR